MATQKHNMLVPPGPVAGVVCEREKEAIKYTQKGVTFNQFTARFRRSVVPPPKKGLGSLAQGPGGLCARWPFSTASRSFPPVGIWAANGRRKEMKMRTQVDIPNQIQDRL